MNRKFPPERIRLDKNTELRAYKLSDAPLLFALTDANRKWLRRWLPWLDFVKTVKGSKEFIQLSLRKRQRGEEFVYGLWFGGELVGTVGTHAVDWQNRRTSLGYWIGQDRAGSGLVTRSTQKLVSVLFNTCRLNRIEIHAAVGNTKSSAIAERLGFKKEGRLRRVEQLYGRYVDHWLYARLRSEGRA